MSSSTTTTIHITALDAIVNVNSLFTFAVFLGLTWNPYDPANPLYSSQECAPGPTTFRNLISFHVFSFSCFLYSSIIALALKQAIKLRRSSHTQMGNINHEHGGGGDDGYNIFHRRIRVEVLTSVINRTGLRIGMLVSGCGSVFGCGFLMLALVNLVQVKLGKLGCGSSGFTYAAVVPLVVLVPVGLLLYLGFVLYAFTR